VNEPRTVAEWEAYVAALDGEELYEQVKGANSITFVNEIKSRGLNAKEIRAVFESFVRRLVACRELPPAGGYFDLRKIMGELGLKEPASDNAVEK
jgi:hypothetical protein